MQENIRRIDTNMYGDIAYRFLYSICPAKSDFLANLGSGLCLGRYKRFIQICKDPNNLIYITINDPCVSLENRADWLKSEDISTYIFDKPDAQILSWLATRIKLYINKKVQHHDWFYEKDDNANNISGLKQSDKWWNSKNYYVIDSLRVNRGCKEDECTTIADLYNICQILKGKKKIENDDRLIGKPLTDDEILNAKNIAEMKSKLFYEFQDCQDKLFIKLHNLMQVEYDKLREQFTKKLHDIDPDCDFDSVFGHIHD
jgi:hypothetical protein